MTAPSEKIRVLFVDDEPLVLQGLQRMLRPMRQDWEMNFVESGARALALMKEVPSHVVVSDMRMPGMDGAALLARIQELYPRTVRLILSGHADKQLIMKCIGTAHQFLAKPCEPDALRLAITRASAFDFSLKNERMKELAGQMDRLPSVPSILNQVVEKLQEEDCTLDDIGNLIAQDLAMTAKLLKLVNSAFFGLRRQISDPSDAISYLGLETIKALVLSLGAFSAFEGTETGPIKLEGLWTHSLQVAGLAKSIAAHCGAEKRIMDESFIGGMLHDIGKLILASNMPEEYGVMLSSARESDLPLCAAELNAFGATHADIGGYLLSLWGLPAGAVDAITFHHNPDRSPENRFSAVTAVHIADALAREETPAFHGTLLDMDYLRSVHLETQLETFRHL